MKNLDEENQEITGEEQRMKEMLAYARESAEFYLNNQRHP